MTTTSFQVFIFFFFWPRAISFSRKKEFSTRRRRYYIYCYYYVHYTTLTPSTLIFSRPQQFIFHVLFPVRFSGSTEIFPRKAADFDGGGGRGGGGVGILLFMARYNTTYCSCYNPRRLTNESAKVVLQTSRGKTDVIAFVGV